MSKHKTDLQYSISEIKTVYEELCDELAVLSRMVIQEDSHLPAYAVSIPYTRTRESSKATIEDDCLEHLYGQDARNHAAEIYSQTLFHEDQEKNTAIRAPGALACSQKTLKQAEKVNRLKEKFSELYFSSATNRSDRKFVRIEIQKYLSIKQTHRIINVLPDTPRLISFIWSGRKRNRSRMYAASVRRLLNEQRQSIPAGWESDQWGSHIDWEMQALSGIPDKETLVISRPVAPQSGANIFYAHDDENTRPFFNCSIPIMYPHNEKMRPVIRELHGYNGDEQHARKVRSSSQTEEEPLISRLNLYRYRETHRVFDNDSGQSPTATP